MRRTRAGSHAKADLDIAARFAPIIYQQLDGEPRFDYITNFDFDGDWRGDNNWQNAANPEFPLRAYVYYSVTETESHFFIHYATFHPRDYKGGFFQSWLLAEAVRRARQELGDNLPQGAEDLTLSHENDMEGCLIVVEKRGSRLDQATVAYIETMAHNKFIRYHAPNEPTPIGMVAQLEGNHPILISEPKGHGMFAYTGQSGQQRGADGTVLVYYYADQPENPEHATEGKVSYRLLPIYGTLWRRAQGNSDETYGESIDYGMVKVSALESDTVVEKQRPMGMVGAAFLGLVGAENKARPPWAWFDYRERDRRPGEWFFDPAKVIKRHFQVASLSSVYVYNPYLDIWRRGY